MKSSSSSFLSVTFESQTPYLNFINIIKSAKSLKTDSHCLEGYIRYRRRKVETNNNKLLELGNLLLETLDR
jgi:hypothetical protein